MAASTVPAAKQAVLVMIRAIPSLNEAAITWSEPTENEDLQDEMVFFEGATERLPEWRILGGPASPLDETYTLPLRVRNRVYDDDAGTAEARTWEIVALIEAAIRADLRLGSLLHVPIVFDEQAVQCFPLSDGWYGEASVPLVCQARI